MPMTETGSQATQDWLKAQALNALAKTYGPMYGDPDSMDKAQQAQTRAAVLPYAAPEAAANVQKTQAETAGTQASTAEEQRKTAQQRIFAVGRLLQSSADPTTGDVDPAVATKVLGNPAIQSYLGIDADTAQQYLPQVSGAGSGARLNGMMNAGMGPAGAMIKGGATVGIGADGQPTIYHTTAAGATVASALPAGTTTTQQENAQTGKGRLALQQTIQPERVGIAQQNANTAAYSAGTRSNNSEFGAAPGTALPAQRGAAPQDSGATVDAIHPGAKAASPTAYIDSLPPKGRMAATAAAQSVVNANTMLGNTNKIIDVADKQIGAFTTGPGGELAHLPGSAATDLAHNLSTVKANVAQAVLTSMKGANGQTGIGRILQSEYQNFQAVLGAVDPSQSAGAVRFHLGLVRQSLAHLNQTLNDTYKAQWKTDPYTALGERNPSAAPSKPPPGLKLPPGFTYIGPAR